jgi:hypothetical protein
MRRMLTVGVVAVAALTLTTTASAITYGEPDGNAHPFVGALLRRSRTPTARGRRAPAP